MTTSRFGGASRAVAGSLARDGSAVGYVVGQWAETLRNATALNQSVGYPNGRLTAAKGEVSNRTDG